MSFIQIIEFTTSRADELDALLDEWLQKTQGKRTATRGVQARDRDRPNTYVQIIEFPSYEQAAIMILFRQKAIGGRKDVKRPGNVERLDTIVNDHRHIPVGHRLNCPS